MFGKVRQYFITAYEEMRKVVWPSREQVTTHTVIVVLAIVVSMALIAALDYGLFNLLQILIYR